MKKLVRVFLEGQKFGMLTVISRADPNEATSWAIFWICKCDCGNMTQATSTQLRRAGKKCCGCKSREMAAIGRTTHGEGAQDKRTGEYNIWKNMKQRCANPQSSHFKYYGGRGITVCERWLMSFEAFLSDMGRRPSAKHSIDRINNDGNYEPSNCRWATRIEQMNNTRQATMVTVGSETLSLSELCERTKIKKTTLRSRLNRGWEVEKAITIPVGFDDGRFKPKYLLPPSCSVNIPQ